jgi:hypothetical protein
MESLDTLVREAKDNAARLPVGLALLAIGEVGEARRKLEGSLENLNEEFPNTMIVRSRVALGEAFLFEGKIKEATEQAQKALGELEGFEPAQAVLCRALARQRDEGAKALCGALIKDGPDPDVLAAWAMVQVATDKEAAVATLRKAKEAGASTGELQTAIKAVDASLFDQLGVPKPR